MGKGKPNRNYDKDGKEANKLRSLQQELKEKNKQIKQLQSEVATLQKAFEKSATFMSDKSKKLSVEDLIKAANEHQPLSEIKPSAPKKKVIAPPTQEELEQKRKETLEKVQKWRKENLGNYEEE